MSLGSGVLSYSVEQICRKALFYYGGNAPEAGSATVVRVATTPSATTEVCRKAAPEGGKLSHNGRKALWDKCLAAGRSERSERSPAVKSSNKRVPEGGQQQRICPNFP